jgi:hypothetical protein
MVVRMESIILSGIWAPLERALHQRHERSLVTAPVDLLIEADRADHRVDTGADRSPWPLLRNGDVPLVRVKSLDGLVDRHLYLARCGSWGTGRRVDGAVSDQEQRSAGCDARTEPPHHLDH